MSAKRQNIMVLAVVAGFLVFLTFTARQPEEWVATWHFQDEEAYGGAVTHDLMEDIFPGQRVTSEFRSLYELTELREDGDSLQGSLLLINEAIELDENDSEALREHLEKGNEVLIAAHYFGGELMDSLGVETDYNALLDAKDMLPWETKVGLEFEMPNFPQKEFEVELVANAFRFSEADSVPYSVLAVNEEGGEVLRRYDFGEGKLYLSSNPLLLTNYFVLDSSASEFTAGLLSLLPPHRPLTHVEYYRMGRMEAQTPLRYFLSQPLLRAAVYITIIGLLLFMIFEAKRRQRVIPVVKPPKNTSVEFAETLGQLHFHTKGDHLNMAQKRVNYLLEYIRNHYYLSTSVLDEQFTKDLAQRSGQSKERLEVLMRYVRNVREGHISEKEFLELEKELNRFYGVGSEA